MRSVLGIDAAWTKKNPSGVALAQEEGDTWRLVAVAASYAEFCALRGDGGEAKAASGGDWPGATALLEACSRRGCSRPELIAVDMPMSKQPIVGRRESDRAVSRKYGARKCSTHSPSVERPGPISDVVSADFSDCGYPLRTGRFSGSALIEVYPHPALVELAGAEERLTYKAGKRASYWPDADMDERRKRLLLNWEEIVACLDRQIEGVRARMPKLESENGAPLKSFEDALDAVVCAWAAICAIDDRAEAYGDHNSAIWIPKRDGGWKR